MFGAAGRKAVHAAALLLRSMGNAGASTNLLHAVAYNLLPARWKPERVRHRPLSYAVYVNAICNYRCPFCFLITTDHPGTPSRTITEEQFQRIVDHPVNRSARRVTLGGGEPFLHPDLFRFVEVLQRRGVVVSIYTNGSLLERRLGELAGRPPRHLNISHYDEEFPALESAVREVCALPGGPRVRLSKLLERGRPEVLQPMVELCLANRIPTLIFQNYFPYRNRSVEKVIPAGDAEFLAERRRLSRLYRRAPIEIIWPNLPSDSRSFGCQNLALSITYDSEGNIAPCCFIVPPSPQSGNLFRDGDAWNSPALRAMRRDYGKKTAASEACRHCYFKNGLQNRYK
jgi:radical SAM protein with 4Fe4S-binding SPASM domain